MIVLPREDATHDDAQLLFSRLDEALHETRRFALSQCQLSERLQAEFTQGQKDREKLACEHANDKRSWEVERDLLQEAGRRQCEALAQAHSHQVNALIAKHKEAMETAHIHKQLLLPAAIDAAEVGLAAGADHHTQAGVDAETASARVSYLEAKVAALERDLQQERTERANERLLQQKRLAYETERHWHYKQKYFKIERSSCITPLQKHVSAGEEVRAGLIEEVAVSGGLSQPTCPASAACSPLDAAQRVVLREINPESKVQPSKEPHSSARKCESSQPLENWICGDEVVSAAKGMQWFAKHVENPVSVLPTHAAGDSPGLNVHQFDPLDLAENVSKEHHTVHNDRGTSASTSPHSALHTRTLQQSLWTDELHNSIAHQASRSQPLSDAVDGAQAGVAAAGLSPCPDDEDDSCENGVDVTQPEGPPAPAAQVAPCERGVPSPCALSAGETARPNRKDGMACPGAFSSPSPARSDSGVARQESCSMHSPAQSQTPQSHLLAHRPQRPQARQGNCASGPAAGLLGGAAAKRPSAVSLMQLPQKWRRGCKGYGRSAVSVCALRDSWQKEGDPVDGDPGALSCDPDVGRAGQAGVQSCRPTEVLRPEPQEWPTSGQSSKSAPPQDSKCLPQGCAPRRAQQGPGAVGSEGADCSPVCLQKQSGGQSDRGALGGGRADQAPRGKAASQRIREKHALHSSLKGTIMADGATLANHGQGFANAAALQSMGSQGGLGQDGKSTSTVISLMVEPNTSAQAPVKDVLHRRAISLNPGAEGQAQMPPPPPPEKEGKVGWRQRRADFDCYDQALAVLGVAKALSPARPPDTAALPCIVDRTVSIPERALPTSAAAGYKYREVVRKRSAREQLDGVECEDCKRFYDALDSWGTFGKLPACGHVTEGQAPASAHTGAGGGAQSERPSRQQLCQDASRHRYRNVPPLTPPGFWDMGFMDSLDSRNQS